MAPGNDNWGSCEKLVLESLERLERGQEKANDKIDAVTTKVYDIALQLESVKVKSSLLGAVSGAIPGLIAALVWYIKSGAVAATAK